MTIETETTGEVVEPVWDQLGCPRDIFTGLRPYADGSLVAMIGFRADEFGWAGLVFTPKGLRSTIARLEEIATTLDA
jgi:hypothetical protein